MTTMLNDDGVTFADGSVMNSASQLGFRNKIINGKMDVWQRGTSITPSSGAYTADRWIATYDGTIGSATINRFGYPNGTFSDTKWGLQWSQTVAGSGSTVRTIGQKIESVWTCAGRVVTVSFIASADATRTITPEFIQVFGAGGSPSPAVPITGTPIEITTTPARYSQTFTIPSLLGKSVGSDGNDHLWFRFLLPVNTVMTINITEVQVEVGSKASPFEHRPIGQELALCRRYYRVTAFRHTVSLYAAGAFDSVVFPADDMRVSPTVSWNISEIANATISGSVNGYQLAFTAVAAGTCIIGGLLTQSAEL